MPKYAGTTKGTVEDRVNVHRAKGDRINIRNVVSNPAGSGGPFSSGRAANRWEASMRLRGYDTWPGGIENEYIGTVNCYTFEYGPLSVFETIQRRQR